MKAGIKNEFDFANVLDQKYIWQLNSNFQGLIKTLYPNIKNNDLIECWVSKYSEKSDIKLRVKGNIKGISIKMGHHNSFHMEHIDDFISFLTLIGADPILVRNLNHFIYWKMINPTKSMPCYKFEYYDNCEAINKELNNYYIKILLFIRFIFQGNKNHYTAHALIYGTPNNFLWATREEILNYLINTNEKSNGTFIIGMLSLQTYIEDDKNFIQIKWHTLEKAMNYIKNKRENNVINH